MKRKRAAALTLIFFLLISPARALAQAAHPSGDASARLIGEVFANGRQSSYVSALSDEIGSRLTGTAGAGRGEEWAGGERKGRGLATVRREPYRMGASWERGPAS